MPSMASSSHPSRRPARPCRWRGSRATRGSRSRRSPYEAVKSSEFRANVEGLGEGVARERVLFDDPPTDQVLLNDPLQHLGRAGVVPDALGVDDRDRAMHADAQAVGLGTIDAAVRERESQLLEALLEIVPRLDARLFGGALWLCLVAAQKDMARVVADHVLRDLVLKLFLQRHPNLDSSASGRRGAL